MTSINVLAVLVAALAAFAFGALWAIDGGFHVGRFAIMGLVIGAWP